MAENSDSVTRWLSSLCSGSDEAAQKIWDRYFEALTKYARRRLGCNGRELDEEDVAIVAMNSFFLRAKNGSFSELHDREDLWKLLIVITARKVNSQKRHKMAQKRGGGRIRGQSVFSGNIANDLAEIAQDVQPDQLLYEILHDYRVLLDSLEDPMLRQIAEFRFSGLSAVAIAEQLRCSRRSVERKLERIRVMWISEFE